MGLKEISLRFKLSWIKISNFEFWPIWAVYFPVFFYWIYHALVTRNFTYFTLVNPGIEYGGVFGESKINILKKIPEEFLPKSLYFEAGETIEPIKAAIEKAGVTYPFVCKPDKGEMGHLVCKINNELELNDYVSHYNGKLIVQEFIEYEIELGVLFYRYPDGSQFGISSVVEKEFLHVIGNGHSTIEELLSVNHRGVLQIEPLKKRGFCDLNVVPKAGEKILIEPIGNHCRGTMFLNGASLINEQLVHVFYGIAQNMIGFNYGRFDLKVKSIADLYNGKNIKIMEVNGVTSEPGHIYDPSMKLIKIYQDIFRQMDIVKNIALMNQKHGFKPTTAKELIQVVRSHFKQKSLELA